MPSRESSGKKRKVEAAAPEPAKKFTNAADIRRSLSLQDESGLIHALTTLRNQFTVKYDEAHIAASDERLLLLKAWLEVSPGAQDVFSIWGGATLRQSSLLSVLVALLSSIVTLLSSHYTYHSLAQPILRTLFSPQWMHRLNSYLGGSHTELVLVTLKLFNSLTSFAGGKERKTVYEGFAWETKSLSKLLHMRRKNRADVDVDPFARPDIRTLFIQFLLSFVDNDAHITLKTAFLEHRRELFASTFKGLWQDHFLLIRRVLEVSWTGVWLDQKVKRSSKIVLFNETVISQLVRLYKRDSAENDDSEHIPADVAHHFLLAICTHPGVGICFRDRGWYPRDADGEEKIAADFADTEDGPSRKSGKIYNKILANVLKNMKVNDDPRQQELALKILGACPELAAGYWSSCGLALEPRNSSKWITNIAFLGAVISLPVPIKSFILPDGHEQSLYQPSPPPLPIVLENIMPSLIKNHLSRGLQSASALVQHCSALVLVKGLVKYVEVLRVFEEVAKALEEDEEGQWSCRRVELEREFRKRIPDFQVVVGFSQKLGDGNGAQNHAKFALLSESAQRLLWLYQRSLPSAVSEARFDMRKLLLGFQEGILDVNDESAQYKSVLGLHVLRQLHVLRLLKESEQFNWAGKTGSSHSNLHTLLKVYVKSTSRSIRNAVATFLQQTLSNSLLFQHDPPEVFLWFDSIPRTVRPSDAIAPDGAPLTDEGEGVISFLDDCAQRCVKTPYRYFEDLQILISEDPSTANTAGDVVHIAGQSDNMPSPLLMTVLEQFNAKLKSLLLSPSDALAISTFMRKLVGRLPGKMESLRPLTTFVKKVTEIVQTSDLYPQYPSVTSGIRRESDYLAKSIDLLLRPGNTSNGEHDPESPSQADRILDSSNESESASNLSDSFRLIDHPLDTAEVRRRLSIIEGLDRTMLKEFIYYLRPDQYSLWNCVDVAHRFTELRDVLDFDVLLVHCDDHIIKDAQARRLLVGCLFKEGVEPVDVKRALLLITHRMTSSPRNSAMGDLLRLLADTLTTARGKSSREHFSELVSYSFNVDTVRNICNSSLPQNVRQGLADVLEACFEHVDESHKLSIRNHASQWTMWIAQNPHAKNDDEKATAIFWIKFMSSEDLLTLLDYLSNAADHLKALDVNVAEEVLHAIAPLELWNTRIVTHRLPELLALRSALPHPQPLDSILATVVGGCLPLCHDGLIAPIASGRQLSDLLAQADQRWLQRAHGLSGGFPYETFFTTRDWTNPVVDILISMLYTRESARSAVAAWLTATSPAPCNTHQLARILRSFFDSRQFKPEGDDDAWIIPHYSRVLRGIVTGKIAEDAGQFYDVYTDCISLMTQQSTNVRPRLLSLLQEEFGRLTPNDVSSHVLKIVRKLWRSKSTEIAPVAEPVLDMALRWAVQHFSANDDGTQEGLQTVAELSTLLSALPPVKSHLAEPVITVIIQNHLSNTSALRFMEVLIKAAKLKPVTVNKYLQNIVQHPRLFGLCRRSDSASCRNWVIRILHTLFNLYPMNTCQATHVEPLLRLYMGTMSSADRMLLSVFQLFERIRKTSVAALFSRWSPMMDATSSSTLEALQSLDPSVMFKTCLAFPDRRSLWEDVTEGYETPVDQLIYDPVFLLLLFAQMLSEVPPTAAPGWVQLFRTNIVSVLIRGLSAKDQRIRDIAFGQLSALFKCLEDADLHEKPQVTHILNLLKDVITKAPDGDLPRLPAYTTLLLAHALRGVFYPANFIYPISARFLLQRPEIDMDDVPMLFGMLYSASDQWKKERGWIVRFISDGMIGSAEWRVLKRRHTWDLLASLFQSEEKDRGLRHGILEVLANVTCNARAATSLVLKSSLLSWIELQLRRSKSDEDIAWIKILENIMSVVDPAKIEASTNGEWRTVLYRCILKVLNRTPFNQGVFGTTVQCVLRLSLLPGPPIPGFHQLLTRCMSRLKELETTPSFVDITRLWTCLDSTSHSSRRTAPHSAHDIFVFPPETGAVEDWGGCVEALWRVVMLQAERPAEWDELTARLLVLRALLGEEKTKMGEWARKETVRLLGQSR